MVTSEELTGSLEWRFRRGVS